METLENLLDQAKQIQQKIDKFKEKERIKVWYIKYWFKQTFDLWFKKVDFYWSQQMGRILDSDIWKIIMYNMKTGNFQVENDEQFKNRLSKNTKQINNFHLMY